LVERQRLTERYREKRRRLDEFTLLRGEPLEQTFASFDLRDDEGEKTAQVRIAYVKARHFADDPQRFLVLHGSRGTGKSHLAAAIANEVQHSNEDPPPLVLFFVVPELLEMLRSGYAEGDYQELFGLCKSVDVLILDDLGTEQETDWAYEKLFQIINRRYVEELPTVVVTNCRLRELESRIYSRLADDRHAVVNVTAPDYRQLERNPGKIV
jgi:DNA replication protein DnaC